MIELFRTNDAVLLSLVEAILDGAGIGVFVADRHVSAVEGSIGAFPRRVLVPAARAAEARRVLVEAGIGAELADEP